MMTAAAVMRCAKRTFASHPDNNGTADCFDLRLDHISRLFFKIDQNHPASTTTTTKKTETQLNMLTPALLPLMLSVTELK